MEPVDALSAWFSPSDLDKKESDERDPTQGVTPHTHRGVVGAHNQSNQQENRFLIFGSLPEICVELWEFV